MSNRVTNGRKDYWAFTKLFGLAVTFLMLIAFGPKVIDDFMVTNADQLVGVLNALLEWHDDPTGFLVSYLIGYVLIWSGSRIGPLLVMGVAVLATVVNYKDVHWLIFTLPAFFVGFLYYAGRVRAKKTTE